MINLRSLWVSPPNGADGSLGTIGVRCFGGGVVAFYESRVDGVVDYVGL
jgi:hypothetical protein